MRLVSLIALAHLLDPSDFGLVAMVTVITGAFEIFANGGLSAATVQRAGDLQRAGLNTLLVQYRHRHGAFAALPRDSSRPQPVLPRPENIPDHRCPRASLHRQCHRRSASRSSAKRSALCHLGDYRSRQRNRLCRHCHRHGPCRIRLLVHRRECHRLLRRHHHRRLARQRLDTGTAARHRARRLDAALRRHSHAQQLRRVRRLQFREGSARTLFRLRCARALQQGLRAREPADAGHQQFHRRRRLFLARPLSRTIPPA